jgi:signal transduction histidine kinase
LTVSRRVLRNETPEIASKPANVTAGPAALASAPGAIGASRDVDLLVVDANDASRAALRDLLGPLGRIVEASSGKQAVQLAAGREFAAILIDMRLPDADGFSIITELRAADGASQNVPVLFLTDAPPDWLTERQGYALGALGYVSKPIDPQALRSKVEILVALSRRGMELRQRQSEMEIQQAAVREAHEALEKAMASSRVKDVYMGILGHDLRSPLGAIIMSSRMLLMRTTLNESDRETVYRIARTAERMAALIQDILDYTRGQAAGGIPIVPRPVDMREICLAMVEEMSLLHADRTIELQVGGDLRGQWDRGRIEQVLSNLLANAVHHGEGAIRVSAEGNASEVLVRIYNRGNPIPPDQLPDLFEPFRRGPNSWIGLGLGLYIVREIMRAHGGTVEVESSAERGTTFTTRWPRRLATTPTGTYVE